MSDEQVRVWVGAFGKHPGWDDHIADQGLETELLSQVKRLLYLEGIGGNIDSGAWEGLDEDEKLPGFDHVLLWRWPGGLVVGRLWSSSDGKGRTRYPMIVCAHCRGLSGSWVAGHCLEVIEALATRCREATDAAGVITAVDDARRKLRSDSASAPLALKGPLEGPPAIVELAAEDALGKQGLERVAYQLEREFGSFLLTDEESGTRSRTIDVRPRHMRVPACRSEAGAACVLWLRFLLERADPSVPLVAVFRRGERFCDLIAGEPTRSQFSCFQSSLARMPLTTEIPYTIDPAFAEQVAARIEAGRNGTLRDTDLGRVAEQPTRIRRPPIKADRSQMKLVGMVAGAVVLLIVLIVAAMKVAGGGGGSGGHAKVDTDDSKPVAPVGDRPTVQSADAEARRAAFVEWCRDYTGWFGPLTSIRGEDRAVLEGDAHLASRVLGPIEAAQNKGVVLHPLDAVSNPPPTVSGLADSPPSEVVDEKVWSRTEAARAVIREVAEGLESWPTRQQAEAVAARLESAQIPAPAAQLRTAAKSIGPGAEGSIVLAAQALSRLANGDIAREADQVDAVMNASALMKKSADRVLEEESATFDEFLTRVRSSADLASLSGFRDELGEMAKLSASLTEFIRGGLDEVDPVVFAAQSQAHQGSFRGVDRLRLWLSEAKRPEMRKLDPMLDPRRSTDVAASLRGVDEAIAGINESARSEMAAEFVAISDRRAEVGASAQTLLATPWNTRTRAEVERETRAVSREIASLGSDVQDLRAAISQNVAEKLAELKARESFAGSELASVDEIWRSGRDALIARYEADRNDLALFRDSRALSDALRAVVDAAQAESGAVSGRPTWNSAPIVARQTASCESAVRAHAAVFAGGLVQPDQVRAAVSGIGADVARADAELGSWIESLGAIETHLQGFFGLDEGWADGGTIRARVAGLGANADEARAIAPAVFAEVATLERVASAGRDRARLLTLLAEPGLGDSGALAAWRALDAVSPAWPGGADELRQEMDLSTRVRTAARGLGDGARAGELEATVDRELARRWATAVGRSPDWADLRACVQLREACGGKAEDLSEAARFNLGVLALREAMNTDDDDAANRARVAAALASPAFAAAPAGDARGWLTEVREIVDEDGAAIPPLDPSAVGPALAGWRVVEGSSEERLVYEFGSRNPSRLAFRLVTLATGESSYLCETELTVGVVAHLADADPAFAKALVASLDWIEPQRDARRGMLTWEWSGTQDKPGLIPASAWISSVLVPLDEYLIDSGGAKYPTEDYPMQRLALSNALFVSARLGCRLPTEAEWKAARVEVESIGVDGGWNMRDQSLARQAAHVAAKGSAWGQPMPPDSDGQDQLRGDPAYGFDDGSIWLMAESAGPEVPFRHMIGNVHEFVILDPKAQSEALGPRTVAPDQESPRRWYSVARGIEAGVIGGSLFSRSDAPVDSASPVGDVRGGWSDVGVRLAFSPGSGRVRRSVASRVASLVDDAPLLRAP